MSGSITSPPKATVVGIATEFRMRDTIEQFRRSSSLLEKELAVYAPNTLCFTFGSARAGGITPLFEVSTVKFDAVKQILFDDHRVALSDVATQCEGYAEWQRLREGFTKELIAAKAPVSSLRTLLLVGPREPIAVEGALTAALTSTDQAVNLMMLSSTLGLASASSIESLLPQGLRQHAEILSVVAHEVAACRLGSPCAETSVFRKTICMRFGECREPTLELSYIRLFSLYNIPFEPVSQISQHIAEQVKNNDMQRFAARVLSQRM